MNRKMKTEGLSLPIVFAILALSLPLAGCGLKGDLYIPEPPTEVESDADVAEPDTIDAEASELDSEEESTEISD